MTLTSGVWSTGNIYPEIYFANSQVTWANQPLSTPLRRNAYHIMNFKNPFTMVGDMYFYIEFNAYPVSTVNSADLQIYLVEKSLDITTFNSTWFENESVELVGTLTKSSTYHHTHSVNSGHRIVPIATNSDGTVGSKHLDINGDFWIVLYSSSPNNNRGWNLQYQPASLCNQTNRWYTGDISGWTTTSNVGCPDSHVHIARRNINKMDGIDVILRATYNYYGR